MPGRATKKPRSTKGRSKKKTSKKPAPPPADATATELVTAPPPVRQVFDLLVKGYTEEQILETINTAWPDESPRVIIDQVMAKLGESGQFSRDIVRGWCFEAYREIYRETVALGDYATAIRAVKEIHNML